MEQTNLKRILVVKVIAFESGTNNCQNPEQDNCYWQSVCYETPLGFNISIREIISERGSLRVLKKSVKSALMLILQEFGIL